MQSKLSLSDFFSSLKESYFADLVMQAVHFKATSELVPNGSLSLVAQQLYQNTAPTTILAIIQRIECEVFARYLRLATMGEFHAYFGGSVTAEIEHRYRGNSNSTEYTAALIHKYDTEARDTFFTTYCSTVEEAKIILEFMARRYNLHIIAWKGDQFN